MKKVGGIFEEIANMSSAMNEVFGQAIGAGGDLDQHQTVVLQVIAEKISYLANLGWVTLEQGDTTAVDAANYFMHRGWDR